MSAIDVMIPEPVVRAIGWALLHFVWQGALVSVSAAVVLRLLRHGAPDVRYVVAAIALAVMATLPIVTGVQALDDTTRPALSDEARLSPVALEARARTLTADERLPATAPADREQSAAGGTSVQALAARAGAFADERLPLFVALWMAGVGVLALRLFSGWLWVQRLASRGATPADAELQAVTQRLRRRLHIGRRVRLLQSSRVDVPTVIGWLKPTILLPVSALAGLSPAQLEAILAHELAHIRRHDYLVNLLQTLLETLLFYHPGVWWLSKQIRIERENCCDDLAVSLCGDRVLYARTLADLEELRGPGGRLVMAATGGTLLARVRRLLAGPANHAGRGPAWLAATTAVMLMVAVGTGLTRQPVVAMEPGSPVVGQRSGDPLVDLVFRAIHSVRDLAFWWQTPMPPPPGPPPPASPGPMPEPPPPPPPPAPPDDWIGSTPVPQLPALPSVPMAAPLPPAPAVPYAPIPERVQAPAAPPPPPPSMPAPPALPAPPAFGMEGSTQDSTGSFTWTRNGDRLEVKYRGSFELSDDDSDIVKMSPNGFLRISDGGWLRGRSVEFTSDSSGQITRRFFIGSSERPFDPEGRAWLAQTLPRFVRSSGFAAKSRVARFLRSGGVPAVLAEISLIEGSYGKKTYFVELIRTASLDAATARRVLEQAGRELTSDYELATLLIAASEKLLVDEATHAAYFQAATKIRSDYEKRRAYAAALERGTISPTLLTSMLEGARTMKSDYELATLLIGASERLLSDRRSQQAYFDAAKGIRSSYEKRRAYTAGLKRGPVPPEVLAGILDGARTMSSSHETASLLIRIVEQHPIEGEVRAPFFAVVETISSAHDKGRVLRALLARKDVSSETVLAVLQAASTMTSSHDTLQVLQNVVRSHPVSGPSRDAYIKAAERLSNYEQSQALAALVRAEKR